MNRTGSFTSLDRSFPSLQQYEKSFVIYWTNWLIDYSEQIPPAQIVFSAERKQLRDSRRIVLRVKNWYFDAEYE